MANEVLSDLKVLEFGNGISASYCSKALADLGAEVIKIEPPDGDATRLSGPFPNGQQDSEKSGLFLSLNVNKKSVTIDLASADGKSIFLQLVRQSDVLIENNTPRELEDLGLTYEVISRENPHLVMTSITPFGQSGPYRDYLGTDLIAFYMGGYASQLTGPVDNPKIETPLWARGNMAEFLSGTAAATATMMAVFSQIRGGGGRHVDVSMQEVVAHMLVGPLPGLAYGNEPVSRTRKPGTGRTTINGIFPCLDGYMAMSPREEAQWSRLIELMGNPEWAGEERFSNRAKRGANWDELEQLLIDWTKQQTKQGVFRAAQAARIPCFPVNTPRDVFAMEQFEHRNFFTEVEHPKAGKLVYPTVSYRFSDRKPNDVLPAPLLGQHNDEILERLKTINPKRDPISSEVRDMLPLQGVRVTDLSWIIAGPSCTRHLAAMGAEVIKVETRKRPDPGRETALFQHLGQSKLSCNLDLSTPTGLDMVKKLIATSDVVVDNFATGVMERLGLGYDVLKELKPDIIMLTSSGLGRTGPDKDLVAYGTLVQTYTGWSNMNIDSKGLPIMGGAWSDPMTGLLQALVIVASLEHKSKTGEGQYIDVSMAEAVTSMMPEALMQWQMNNKDLESIGNKHYRHAPHGIYPCAGDDQWLAIAITNDLQWQSLVAVIGDVSLTNDRGYADASSRKDREPEIDLLIEKWTRELSPYDAMERLQNAGVPSGVFLNPRGLADDPHLKERRFLSPVIYKDGVERMMPVLPWRFVSGPEPRLESAPLMGEHNSYIFEEILGISSEEVSKLIETQVIY